MAHANETSPARKDCFQCHRPAETGDGRCKCCNLEAEASEAFWAVIVRHFPEARSGDLSVERTVRLRMAGADAVEEWIRNNVLPQDIDAGETEPPTRAAADSPHCKTCGSEIVETINDSCFNDGECGPCEYQRYRSQPDLLEACQIALEEIEQWDEVVGGSEDPRTAEAIKALTSAIDGACESRPETDTAGRPPSSGVPR